MKVYGTGAFDNDRANLVGKSYIDLCFKQIKKDLEWLESDDKCQVLLADLDILLTLAQKFSDDVFVKLKKSMLKEWEDKYNTWFEKNQLKLPKEYREGIKQNAENIFKSLDEYATDISWDMNIEFRECERKLTEEDFNKVENILQIDLPKPIKLHYQKYNGGYPERTLVNDEDEVFGCEISNFMPLLYCEGSGDDPNFTLEGRTLKRWDNGVIPRYFLPFAMDWGGNYFCYHLDKNSIYYYVTDIWSDNISAEKNFIVNSTFLASCFSEFLDLLIDNPMDDRF